MELVNHFGLAFIFIFLFFALLNYALRKLTADNMMLVLNDYMNILLQTIICSFIINCHNVLFDIVIFLLVLIIYLSQVANIITVRHYGFKINLHRCRVRVVDAKQRADFKTIMRRDKNLILFTVLMFVGIVMLFLLPFFLFKYYLLLLIIFSLHLLTGGEFSFSRLCCWLLLVIILEILLVHYISGGLAQFPTVLFNRIVSCAIGLLILLYIWHFFSKKTFFCQSSLLREQFREETPVKK